MPIDKEDIKELTECFDHRYRRIDDCNSEHESVNHKLYNDDKRIAVFETKLNFNNWLSAAIAVGVISLVIKVFLGG